MTVTDENSERSPIYDVADDEHTINQIRALEQSMQSSIKGIHNHPSHNSVYPTPQEANRPALRGHGYDRRDLDKLVQFIEEDGDGEGINSLRQETRVRVAMDSGSCRNVTHPKTPPSGVKVTPNTSGKHFSGAGGWGH